MYLKSIKKEISDADFMWIAERTNTLPSGLVTFPAHVIKKYRLLTGQDDLDSKLLKLQMVREFGDYA